MRRKSNVSFGPGAASLILIVVILSMGVLGMLALMNARNDARLSQRSMEVVAAGFTLNDRAEREEALRLALKYDLYVSGGEDHSGLCGGQYIRYEHPEETRYYVEPLSLGTTEYFFGEIRDRKKNPDRKAVIEALLPSPEM